MSCVVAYEAFGRFASVPFDCLDDAVLWIREQVESGMMGFADYWITTDNGIILQVKDTV